jgi:hypothetical protein
MIGPELRRSVLATFPPGTPLLVVAPNESGFAALLRERNDAAASVCAPEELALRLPVPSPVPHLLLEGLDAVDDPAATLALLRARAPQARLFSLVANAANVRALGAFYAGTPPARGHPLLIGDLEPLFLNAGWRPLAIKAYADASLPGSPALPVGVDTGDMVFTLADSATFERARTAAYLVIADP